MRVNTPSETYFDSIFSHHMLYASKICISKKTVVNFLMNLFHCSKIDIYAMAHFLDTHITSKVLLSIPAVDLDYFSISAQQAHHV